ncbi:hypothetical protein BCR33DRAFT_846744 [Rhizoclosmatium globosum]|uniref:Uncharacterized protein n=1 Tax=Rhizoclosmatium globosum TaxID=329046 RepID=A0A1Y2CXQ6_9FUNG|nr:hypothetical protein BCR33DRAFT_846744 [Rhizoclosmatium globosum]|eukprot:ORY51115.1 hypothetical protein BCR33DRAFT_846744 [Rhizoclosmatium globosum]
MVLAKLNGDLLPANATHSEYPQGLSRSCVISDKKGGIFAIVSVFHFGVASNLTKLEKNHWDRGYSPKETVERVKWLPYFLRAIASHVFPEFCNLAKQECPPPKYFKKVKNPKLNDSVPPLLDPKNPFWFPKPDLILTQSMLWDLMLRNEDQQFDAFANDWVFGMREFINVVQETFGGAVKNVKTRNGEILPRYLIRTTPLPDEKDGNGKTFHTEEKFSPVNALNYLMRSGYLNSDVLVHESHHDNTKSKDKKNLEAKQVGLLDWDKLMAGTQSHSDDGLHPNMFSSNAFIQLLFSRLELLYQGTPRY